MQGNIKVGTKNQSTNGNNGCYDYEEMIKALIALCKNDELLICLDKKGIVKHIKETARNKLLHNGNELLGKCMWDLLPPDLAEKRKAVFSSRKNLIIAIERQIYQKDHKK
jgi:hypothetical protein